MKIRGNTVGTTVKPERVLAKAGGTRNYYSTERKEVGASHDEINLESV